MRLTRRGQILAGLTISVGVMLNSTIDTGEHTRENTPSISETAPTWTIFEDGSAVVTNGDREVMTYPEGTFPKMTTR